MDEAREDVLRRAGPAQGLQIPNQWVKEGIPKEVKLYHVGVQILWNRGKAALMRDANIMFSMDFDCKSLQYT